MVENKTTKLQLYKISYLIFPVKLASCKFFFLTFDITGYLEQTRMQKYKLFRYDKFFFVRKNFLIRTKNTEQHLVFSIKKSNFIYSSILPSYFLYIQLATSNYH